MPKVWSSSSPSHYLKHQKQVVFTGLDRRNWIPAQRIQIWRPHWETKLIQNKHYLAIFYNVSLSHSFFSFFFPIPSLLLIVFSSLKGRVSIHQSQGGNFPQTWVSETFQTFWPLLPAQQITPVSFTMSKYGESIKSVNKMKGIRNYLGQSLWSSSDFFFFFPPGLTNWGLCYTRMDSGRFQESPDEAALKAEPVLSNPLDGEGGLFQL